MEEQGVIYKIENLVNGKIYVGQSKNFEARKSGHLSELRNNKKINRKLQNSWNKHGEHNFKFRIIGKYPIRELDEKEIYFIKKYNSFHDGYNLTTGGNQGTPNHKVTEETRKIISYKSKKVWQRKGYREKMSDIQNSFRKVVLINTGEVFESAKHASAKYTISMSNITRNCNKKGLSAGKDKDGNPLIWCWASEYTEERNYVYTTKMGGHNRKKVVCINTGEVFKSAAEAERHYGIGRGGVTKTCRGKRNYTGLKNGTKLKWKYA